MVDLPLCQILVSWGYYSQYMEKMFQITNQVLYMGLSENVGYIPNEIAIFYWDNDHKPLALGVHYFQTHPYMESPNG